MSGKLLLVTEVTVTMDDVAMLELADLVCTLLLLCFCFYFLFFLFYFFYFLSPAFSFFFFFFFFPQLFFFR